MRSRTELESQWLSAYHVRTWLTKVKSSKLKLSAISFKELVWCKWWGYKGFHLLSLILKSPIIIRMLFKFILVFLKYFKVDCWSSEYILIRKHIMPLLKKKTRLMSLWLKYLFLKKNITLWVWYWYKWELLGVHFWYSSFWQIRGN